MAFAKGSVGALATAQLRLGEDLGRLEPRFLLELSFDQREELVGDFSTMADGVLAMLDVEEIIHNASHK